MSIIQKIKALQAHGYGISRIAEELGLDRKTVRKYVQQTDFSRSAPIARSRVSKLDPYKATIAAWLEDDHKTWQKQRHTAQRIFDRLGEEFPDRAISYGTVRRYVHERHRQTPTTGTLELEWHPGEARMLGSVKSANAAGSVTPSAKAARIRWPGTPNTSLMTLLSLTFAPSRTF